MLYSSIETRRHPLCICFYSSFAAIHHFFLFSSPNGGLKSIHKGPRQGNIPMKIQEYERGACRPMDKSNHDGGG